MLNENVQRKFTSRIKEFNEVDEETGLNMCTVDYWERLKQLKAYSLERRRERYIIIFMYKIINQLYPNPGIDLSFIVLNMRQGIKIPKIKMTQKLHNGSSAFVQLPSAPKGHVCWRLFCRSLVG